MRGRAESKQSSNTTRAAEGPAEARQPRSKPPPPFTDILCAVDGSHGSDEGTHQAIALCRPEAALRFVAISHQIGTGLSAQADLSEMRARSALEKSVSIARRAGIGASASLLRGAPASDLLLAEATKHELLVVGCHGGSRLGGIMLGSTASQLAHRAERPLLVARRTVDADRFPQSILLATDGSPGSWAAARISTGLAKAERSELRLVYVPDGTHPERYREVLKQLTVIEKATGSPPAVVDNPGHVAERIGEAARAAQSSVIVIGRRGASGIKALGSVSERVVHRAPCSALVVPPPSRTRPGRS
jgi:nucleotide-binding universal stress UspA family protein